MTEDSAAHTDMLTWARAYAHNHGWELNSDEKQLMTVIRGLVRNTKKFGRPYCPCRLRSGDEEKDRAIECPCVYHKDEVSQQGHCHCNLYFNKV